jgi:hypothetical protein
MYTGNPHQKSTNPNWISEKPWGHYKRKAEEGNVFDKIGFGVKDWMHENMPLTNTKWDATNSTQGRLSPYGPLAELTQKQMDFMGSPYNTPAFGVSKEDLWDKTKGMEKKGFFGWGAQEPTTTQEFNDYYKQLEQGTTGNWLAMAGKKKGPLATVPGSVVAPNVPEHTGFSDDLFKQDPHRTYNHGYRYNNYGLQPLYFG